MVADLLPLIFTVAVAAFVGTGLRRSLRAPETKLAEEGDRVPLAELYCGAMFGGLKSATWPFVRVAAYEDALVIVCDYVRDAIPYSTISAWLPERRLGSNRVRLVSSRLLAPAILWIEPGSRLFHIVKAKVDSASERT